MSDTTDKLHEASEALAVAASEVHNANARADMAEMVADEAREQIDAATDVAADVMKAAAETAIMQRLDDFEKRQDERWRENQTVHAEIRERLTALESTPSTPQPSPRAEPPEPPEMPETPESPAAMEVPPEEAAPEKAAGPRASPVAANPARAARRLVAKFI